MTGGGDPRQEAAAPLRLGGPFSGRRSRVVALLPTFCYYHSPFSGIYPDNGNQRRDTIYFYVFHSINLFSRQIYLENSKITPANAAAGDGVDSLSRITEEASGTPARLHHPHGSSAFLFHGTRGCFEGGFEDRLCSDDLPEHPRRAREGSHTGLRCLGRVRRSWCESQASRRAAFRCSPDDGNGHEQLPLYAPSSSWRRRMPSSSTESERPEASGCRDCSDGTQGALCWCRSHSSVHLPACIEAGPAARNPVSF